MTKKIRILRTRFNLSHLIVFCVLFGAVGSVLLFRSFASGPTASLEPENGALSGSAAIGSDSLASAGKFVQFGGAAGGSASTYNVIAAGDIACDPTSTYFNGGNGVSGHCQEKATSDLVVAAKPDAVLVLGDIQYESDVLSKYTQSYDPTWGRFKTITHPTIGNHEGGEGGSNADYFKYFGSAAGATTKGYYSFDLGNWHLIALNANCGFYSFNGSSTGCQAGSPQEQWLKSDLAANPGKCIIAYWHVPYYSSGHAEAQGANTAFSAFWQDLYNAHADIVLNGHDHDYERFAKQDAGGKASSTGAAEFVVGTGGRDFTGLSTRQPNSAVFNGNTFGVLHLTLHPTSYDWKFLPISGSTFTDSGSAACNG